MKKYVVAYYNAFDGELKQEIVEATSKLEAGFSYLGYSEDDAEGIETLDQLYDHVFNLDCMLNVLDLNKALSTGRPGGGLQIRVSQFDSESRFH